MDDRDKLGESHEGRQNEMAENDIYEKNLKPSYKAHQTRQARTHHNYATCRDSRSTHL